MEREGASLHVSTQASAHGNIHGSMDRNKEGGKICVCKSPESSSFITDHNIGKVSGRKPVTINRLRQCLNARMKVHFRAVCLLPSPPLLLAPPHSSHSHPLFLFSFSPLFLFPIFSLVPLSCSLSLGPFFIRHSLPFHTCIHLSHTYTPQHAPLHAPLHSPLPTLLHTVVYCLHPCIHPLPPYIPLTQVA